MSEAITIIPQDIINIFLAMCGAIITASGAGAVIIRAISKVREPNKIQNDRLDKLEKEIAVIKEMNKDRVHEICLQNNKLNELESSQKETNIVIIETLQGIVSYTIDGNKDKIKVTQDRLDKYLINKAV